MSGAAAKGRLTAVSLVSLAGIVVSAFLTEHYYAVRGATAGFHSFCNISSTINCDVVALSPYAELVHGFPLSSFAAGWYVAILIAAFLAREAAWKREATRAILFMSAFGVVMSAIYFYLMASVLHTYCLLCLVTDGINLALLGLAVSLKPEPIKKAKLDRDRWKTLGWIVAGSVLVAAIGLKTFDTPPSRDVSIDDLVESVWNTPPVSVRADADEPSLGPSDAPITIAEFSDLQCPHCRVGAYTMHTVMNRFPGKVRLVLKNFPLDPSCNRMIPGGGHPVACEAARVAICAFKLGHFQPVYEEIFEKQPELAPGVAEKFATEQGVDQAKLDKCMSSPETAALLSRSIEDGITLGVQATPTFYINGRKVEGPFPLPFWEKIIERLLAAK